MAYNKHTWEQQELITAEKLNNIENGIINQGSGFINVKSLGAVGDGVTDDSSIINQAFLTASSNSSINTVYIPEGKYLLKNDLDFQSNTHIILNPKATLYGPGMFFRFRSFGKGYGNGVSNVIIEGGTFSGDFNASIDYGHASGNAFIGVLHHAENLTFRNINFYMTTSNSHTLDLGGCRNIEIDNCKFYGINNTTTNREYVESIQIDYSYPSGLTDQSDYEKGNTDGLPTYNVVVKNSEFLPIYNGDGSVAYYAPSAIGSHASFADGRLHGIKFVNNKIVDGVAFNKNVSINGWVHFKGVEDVLIDGNSFINTKGHVSNAIGFVVDKNTQLNPAFTGSTSNIMYDQHNDITISNNSFKGFNSTTLVSPGIIGIAGNGSHDGDNNIRIVDNKARDFFPTSANVTKPNVNGSSNFIVYNYVNSIEISGNDVKDMLRFIYARSLNSTHDSVHNIHNNHIQNVWYMPIYLDNSNTTGNVFISENTFYNTHGSAVVYSYNNVKISDNLIKYSENSSIVKGVSFNDTSMWVRNSNLVVVENNKFIQSKNPDYQYTMALSQTGNISFISNNNTFNGNNENLELNPLRFAMLGDSYVRGNQTGSILNAYTLASASLGLQYYNHGINGGSVAVFNGMDSTKPAIVQRYNNIERNLDLIGIEGGRNDYNNSVPIGNDDDMTNTTFKGALNIILTNLAKQNPQAVIFGVPCWKVTAASANSAGFTQVDYWKAFNDIVNGKFGFPVLDVTNVGVNFDDTTFRSKYAEDITDYSHLNKAGMANYAPKLQAFIKGLL